MITINATMSQMIKIGHQGENKAVQVAFDLTPFQAAFQGGYPQLVVIRPGDQSGYPVALIVNGSQAIWIVSASDAEKSGHGQCELQWFVGDTLAKSDKYNFLIYSSIPGDAEPPDVPSKTWFEKILSDIGDLSDLDTEAKENLVAAINEARQTGGGGAGGTSDHQKLSNRDAADQHPIAAITGLEAALAGKQPAGSYLTNEALTGAVDDALAQAKASGEFDGAPGAAGKSAYQYAQDGGYTGTAEEFSGKMAAEIPSIDNTLTKSGQAADAAVVGDRLSALSEEIASDVSAHNTGTDTHSDIRLLISGLTDRLNALADSDDATLDQLSEVVAYIKSNRGLIDAITTSKVSVEDIVDNLTTNIANKPLSAAQGVALKALIDGIVIPDKLPNPNALTFTGAVTGSYDGTEPLTVNIPSSGGGSGGGGAEFPNWRLIKTISFSADIASVDFDTDDNGNTFSLKEIMLTGTVPAYASGSYIYMKPTATGVQNSIWPTASKDVRWWAASVNGKLKTMLSVSNTSVIWPVDKDPVCENDTISRLIIGSSKGFTADGTMYVYGR